jgi:hypothetical protein
MAGKTLPSGQIIPDQPALITAKPQNVTGGILNAAAGKTIDANIKQAEVAAKMGVGQKGAGKRRRSKRGGAQSLNAPSSLLPSAGSIPGVDPTDTHTALIDHLNQLKASSVGDKLAGASPYYPAKSGGKRTKRKSKHGRRHTRSNRRGHHKSARSNRRSHRTV